MYFAYSESANQMLVLPGHGEQTSIIALWYTAFYMLNGQESGNILFGHILLFSKKFNASSRGLD